MANQNKGFNIINLIPVILMLVAVFIAVGYIASGIYQILEFIALGLFLITLGLDLVYGRKVIIGFAKTLITLVRKNPLMGVIAIGLTVFFHPLVALFLFGKAMLLRKVGNMKKDIETRQQGQYADYEEVETNYKEMPDDKPKLIELPPLREKPKQERSNDYEDLFEE
jgi:hypothetical protein